MKKIIPIIAILGAGAMLVGCNSVAEVETQDSLDHQIQNFQNQVDEYSETNKIESMNTRFNKYNLSLVVPDHAVRVNNEVNTDIETNDNLDNMDTTVHDTITESDPIVNNEDNINNATDTQTDTNTQDSILIEDLENIEDEAEDMSNISTLYSLSSDISESCDDFCELKEEISEAIIETQNLINKVQSNELSLTAEQRMFITEQAKQLKSLGKQLSNITTELSINLSDISTLMRDSNGNIDNLSLKYLIVLDNLVNGNEMLENGLQSLYMINSMINTQDPLAPNNQGRILYGFRRNDEPPIIKDYTIENGEIKETEDNIEDNLTEQSETKKGNIDTYLNTNVNSNLDTYGNKYNNIDTFFNTALLDNELYGNNYGMNMYNGNPYYEYQNNLEQRNNTRYSVDNNINKQDVDDNVLEYKQEKRKKKFKITSNIDTYRDANTPTVSAKFTNIKDSVNNFLSKFKPRKENPDSPIYKLTEQQNSD